MGLIQLPDYVTDFRLRLFEVLSRFLCCGLQLLDGLFMAENLKIKHKKNDTSTITVLFEEELALRRHSLECMSAERHTFAASSKPLWAFSTASVAALRFLCASSYSSFAVAHSPSSFVKWSFWVGVRLDCALAPPALSGLTLAILPD
ncbi:hypothetical protein ALT_3153 [Aspergillus lentulus]|uniref:Uncharacterized protein n=1 Tax=Aspergillus lentulus TaxID=293939 RepID=A0AAN4PG00_ASPLE|nr:hypothetical protein CNMCM6069_003503 [Aspergillus lentulus]KAF4170249.1 hypothetical protein CNMCM6936_003437 [Aspergillus lentulus]GAQ05832.1 hypothetical protein ALT_3153 [Aspergillus lentulus]GFF70004.1 hypothetical protein IFM60648_03055 [Aspergillus lentulus]GFG03461.1 hypothetical protein IFM61392_02817 [Aspergillus lentulus]